MITQLVLTETKRQLSRDEMNLAEFPLAVLATRADPKVKTLEFHDTIRGKNGEVVNRNWIVTGADKFGLPTASDEEVLLGLLKLSVVNTFKERKIFFTRYELLKVLKWTTEGRSYTRLQNALDRLSGVRIKATNAFYDNEAKAHSTRNFGIIDAYEIYDGRDDNKQSFFVWSDVLFKSFQVGFIKKLDLDFYLGLKSTVSRRLYRLLDKHFWYRSRIQMNLFILAHEKIGISRNYKYTSSIRQQLDPAIEELMAHGFISGCEYQGRGQETEVIFFASTRRPRVEGARPDGSRAVKVAGVGVGITDELEARSLTGVNLYQEVSDRLAERGLKPHQIVKLLSNKSTELLIRVAQIIEHFDILRAGDSRLVSKSPIGFLYRAVERPEEFVLPGEGAKQVGLNFIAPSQVTTRTQRVVTQATVAQGITDPRTVGQRTGIDRLESIRSKPEADGPDDSAYKLEYLAYRRQEITRMRHDAELELLDKIRAEVRHGLSNLSRSVSEDRLNQAIEVGVEDKLARLFALPDYDEWLKSARRKARTVAGAGPT